MAQHMNLRQVADCLDIEPWRVLRLGRFLGIDAYDATIQSDEVEKMASLDDPDARYAALRKWLLDHTPRPLYC